VTTSRVWAMIVPVVFADICEEIYHRVCFPLYGIELVKRSRYIRVVDREKLPYLTWYEKLFCAYCGYVNGWFHYASVIAPPNPRVCPHRPRTELRRLRRWRRPSPTLRPTR